MKKSIILFLIMFLLTSCDGISKKMSEKEADILVQAFQTGDSKLQMQAHQMLDKRIEKYHLKNDYANKIQLLVEMKNFEAAYAITEEVIQRYPDYVEMMMYKCILAKKVLPSEQSELLFNNTMKQLNIHAGKQITASYSILSSQFLLSILYSKNNLKEELYGEIMNLHIEEYEKEAITELYTLTEIELLEQFF